MPTVWALKVQIIGYSYANPITHSCQSIFNSDRLIVCFIFYDLEKSFEIFMFLIYQQLNYSILVAF